MLLTPGNRAETAPDHSDPRLRGRRYAIPFQAVWEAARDLADGGMARWTLVDADDQNGELRAESRTWLFRLVDDVEVRIALDHEGQTRVDLTSASRIGGWDLGANARRIRRFTARLDRALQEEGHWTLPPAALQPADTAPT
jgi:hypothetical protein